MIFLKNIGGFPLIIFILNNIASSIDIRIGGIFQIDSISESAFSLAILKHNQHPKRKFRLISTHVMLKQFDSTEVMSKICNQTSVEKVVAIFGNNLSYIIQEIRDLTQILQIPFFTTDHVIYESEKTNKFSKFFKPKTNYLIHMHPPILDSMVDYLIKNEWYTFSYICNTGQGLYRLQNTIKIIHSKKDYIELNVDVRYISDPRLATKDLRNLDAYLSSHSEKRVLIDIDTPKNLDLILHRIVLMGMNRPEYQFIILTASMDEIDLTEFKYSGVEIIGFKILVDQSEKYFNFKNIWQPWINNSRPLMNSYSMYEVALMVDALQIFTSAMDRIIENPISRKHLLSYLNKEDTTNCYTVRTPGRRKIIGYHNRRYEIINSSLGQIILEKILNENYQSGLTGALKFEENGLRRDFSVQILKVKLEKGPVKIGNWSKSRGILIENLYEKVLRKEMIKNQTVRVVTIALKPFLQLKTPKENEKLEGNERYEGFCVDLLNLTAKLLDFKFEIHLVNDNSFGVKIGQFPNGSEIWNGLIGEILNGTADMVVAPLTISLSRARVVHFSEPFLTFGLSVIIKKPGKKKAGIFSFFRPLSYPVWGCYFAACLVVSCGLYIIARMSPYEWNINNPYDPHQKITRDFTFFNCVWFSIAAFVQQGVDVAPKSPGARILSSVWWFFTLIMIAYYTANLAAFLTISLMIPPINDWPDLVAPGVGIEYGTINSGSTKNFFMTTNLEPFRTMGLFMKQNPHVFRKTVEEGVKKVRSSKGNYAFLLESRMNEYFNNRYPCDTMMVGTPYGDNGYGIATPKNYSLNENITDAILNLREKQELRKLYKKWWKEKGECNDDNANSNSGALLLINVAGVFYILAAGLTFAMLTSLIEFYCNSKSFVRKKNTKDHSWLTGSNNLGSALYPNIISDQSKPLRFAEQYSTPSNNI